MPTSDRRLRRGCGGCCGPSIIRIASSLTVASGAHRTKLVLAVFKARTKADSLPAALGSGPTTTAPALCP